MKSKYLMILIWLTLCTLLVVKRVELRIVFLSFLSSFSLAACLLSHNALSHVDETDGVKASSAQSIIDMLGIIMSNKKTRLSSNGNAAIDRIKWIEMVVGVVICKISMILLFHGELTRRTMQGYGNDTVDEEFLALGVVTGYLAFDLWWISLFKLPWNVEERSSTSMVTILEDALTLSGFLTALSMHVDEGYDGSTRFLLPYRSYIFYWLIYKYTRLIYRKKRTVPLKPVPLPKCTSTSDDLKESDTLPSPPLKDKSELWNIHGVLYDLQEFVKRHPGGINAIELGKGRDCTALFHSYHPFTEQHWKVLQKYAHNSKIVSKAGKQQEQRLNENGPKQHPQNPKENDLFYDTLKTRVYKHLSQVHNVHPEKDRCATYNRVLYYIFIFISLLFSLYYHIHASIIGSFSTAIFGWLIGCVGHDGGHYAVSRKPWINDLAVWGISFICNPIMWQHQHTYAHHSHTNEFDHDPDLHHFTIFLRVHPKHSHQDNPQYKWQSYKFYVLLAWFSVVIGTCLKIPLTMMQTGSLYGIVEWTDRKRICRAFAFYFHYVMYIVTIILSPFFFAPKTTSIFTVISCVVIHIMTCGLLFAVFSQINHLNELCLQDEAHSDTTPHNNIGITTTTYDHSQPKPTTKAPWNKISSWAARQVETSNNFAANSFFWHLFSNGLNLQIEHHLFPGLNHCHLHLISSVVEDTCREYGVSYKSYDTWSDIMHSTLAWFDKLAVVVGEE